MYTHEPEGYECPLCIVVEGGETDSNKRSDVIYEDEDIVAYISPKWWKNNPGNVMVIPREHVENIYSISDELVSKVYVLGKRIAMGMKETYGCNGTSFRQHNEPAGNQNVWHFHVHVFPRWDGDDLYLNHLNTHSPSVSERAEYAEKLRTYLHK